MKYTQLAMDPKSINFIVNDKYRILRHVMLVAAFFTIVFFSNWLKDYSGIYKFYRLVYVMIIFMTLFYVNMYILVPRLFFKGRYIIYMLALVVMVKAGIELTSYLISIYPSVAGKSGEITPPGNYTSALEGTVIAVPIILTTTTIKLFQRWVKDNQSITELKNLTLTMELNELRNQISPHFLFNMLNGIKVLIRINPEKAAMVIMKLSEFLRYQLYENNNDKTLLGAEIKFLSNFLSLEALRRDNLETHIRYSSPEGTLNRIMLPPNLFTTFVENAVKHSATINDAKSAIDIEFEIDDDHLCFKCTNSKDPMYIPSDKNSGLGLANIKRRLALLYGDQYRLSIDSKTNEFHVKLTLPL